MPQKYRWDDFVLDEEAYRLERAGAPLSLEPKAFNLLLLLIARPGHLFTKQEIFDAVWPRTAVTDHALTRVVAQLRRVLGDEAREARFIETVPTRGYRWMRPVEHLPASTHGSSESVVVTDGIAAPAPGQQRRSLRVAAALLAIAAGIVLFLWFPRDAPSSATSDAPTHEQRWPVQLTTHAGLDLQPALSPQGDAIAYVSDATGALEIYVRALGGTATAAPLTRDGGHSVQPAWSPDGRFIAFHSYRDGGIWLIPARGGVARQVATTGSNPAWSPDGLRIAFQSDEHADVTPSAFGAQSGSTIWTVGVDGRDLRELTHSGDPSGGHAAPAWSNDGQHVAFTVVDGGSQNGIWIHDLATGRTRLFERGKGLFELVFAPDDSAIYAAGGEALIVRLPFQTKSGSPAGARQVIPVPGVPGVRGLSISSDGRSVAFAGLALNSQIWAQPVNREGTPVGQPRSLTGDTSRRNSVPAISPDGSRLAYVSTRNGELPNVWVMDVSGRNSLQVTSDDAAEWKAQWFPDGRRLAYLSTRNNMPAVWSVDINTRREEVMFDLARARQQADMTALRGPVAEFDLAPSAGRAAFSLITPAAGRRRLYVSSLRQFEPRPLTDGTRSIGYPAWSPDERYLAVEVKDGSSTHAGVIDVQTAALRQVTSERGQTWVRSWSPDSRRLAVAALRAGRWSLLAVDVTTGDRRAITAPEPPNTYLRYPDWSPRGDLVVYERGELRGNIWLLPLK